MSPRRPDPFKAEVGVSYTKGEVNRAGRLIRRYLDIGVASDFDEALATIGIQEVVGAFRAVTWWRSLHARPLTLVAAGLRYHVDKEHGRIDEHIDVTQRLKRRSTIINKLTREPTMEVAQMHDIGGVRARLPTTGHVYAVSRRASLWRGARWRGGALRRHLSALLHPRPRGDHRRAGGADRLRARPSGRASVLAWTKSD